MQTFWVFILKCQIFLLLAWVSYSLLSLVLHGLSPLQAVSLCGISNFRTFGMQAAMCSIFIELYDLLIVSSVCAGLKIKWKQSTACSVGAVTTCTSVISVG